MKSVKGDYMAEYTPVHNDHYIERDSSSGGGIFAVLAVVVILLLLLVFGFRLFGTGNSGSDGGTNINGSGSVNTPSGTYEGSGSGTVQ